jgi:hypothetical protein
MEPWMSSSASRTYLLATAASTVLLVSPAAARDSCEVAGEVFAPNPFDNAITIKEDDSEDIATVQFSNLTRFDLVTVDRAPAGEFDPKTFRAGDRVCVPSAPAHILVIRRLDIQEQQKRVLSELIRNSVFGTVTGLNPEKRSIRLTESLAGGASRTVTVDAGDPAAFRRFVRGTQGTAHAAPSSWENVQVGDSIYVEGRFGTASQTLRAGVVIVGSIQAVAGTIVAINGLGVIDLDDLRSGLRVTIELPADAVFRTAPFEEEAPAKSQPGTLAYWDLHSIGLADLQAGDTIAVLVKAGQDLHKLTGLMAVTGFASFRTGAPPAAPVFWLVDPLKQAR